LLIASESAPHIYAPRIDQVTAAVPPIGGTKDSLSILKQLKLQKEQEEFQNRVAKFVFFTDC